MPTDLKNTTQMSIDMSPIKVQGQLGSYSEAKKGGGVSVDTSFWNMADDEKPYDKNMPKKGGGVEVASYVDKMAKDHRLDPSMSKSGKKGY